MSPTAPSNRRHQRIVQLSIAILQFSIATEHGTGRETRPPSETLAKPVPLKKKGMFWGGLPTSLSPTSRWTKSIIRISGIFGLNDGRFFTTESQRARRQKFFWGPIPGQHHALGHRPPRHKKIPSFLPYLCGSVVKTISPASIAQNLWGIKISPTAPSNRRHQRIV